MRPRDFVRHEAWAEAFELSAGLKTLSLRWGGEVTVDLDVSTGYFVATLRGAVLLASGSSQKEAVARALDLECGRREP